MDPTANLQEQRLLAARLVEASDNDRPIREEDIGRLAELVIALDEWISRGGSLPWPWLR
jgi:hypothetical protein